MPSNLKLCAHIFKYYHQVHSAQVPQLRDSDEYFNIFNIEITKQWSLTQLTLVPFNGLLGCLKRECELSYYQTIEQQNGLFISSGRVK